jgi:hypothetical protein
MKVSERVSKISELQAIDTPYNVWRFFGHLKLHGDQLELSSQGNSDFGNLEEFRRATTWLVDQLGGSVVWDKKTKSSKKDKA